GRSEDHYRGVAAALQRGASTFEPGLSHAKRVRDTVRKRSAPPRNGPGRCGIWAFAPRPVASPAPRGATAASKGGRLKLTVVRRIRAGHIDCRALARR